MPPDLVFVAAYSIGLLYGASLMLKELVTSPTNWRAWVGVFIIIPFFIFVFIVFFGTNLPGP